MRERGHSWVSNSVNEGVTRFDYVFVSFLYFPKFRVFLVLFQRDSIQHCDKKIQMILFLSSQMPFLLGISAPLCADRLCSDSCSLEAKYTGTQYLTWFGKSPTSTGEVHIIRDRERIHTNTWRRRITSLNSTHISHCCTCSYCVEEALPLHFCNLHWKGN